jgi:hypothetical protein
VYIASISLLQQFRISCSSRGLQLDQLRAPVGGCGGRCNLGKKGGVVWQVGAWCATRSLGPPNRTPTWSHQPPTGDRRIWILATSTSTSTSEPISYLTRVSSSEPGLHHACLAMPRFHVNTLGSSQLPPSYTQRFIRVYAMGREFPMVIFTGDAKNSIRR